MKRLLQHLILPAAFLALCTVPWLSNDYIQYIFNLVLAYVVVAIGLNLLLGFAGQFAFAHAAFMGIGAYTAALLSSRFGVSFFLALPASGLLAMTLGMLVALPSFRLKTVYLAMVTMAFAELVQWVLIQWKTVTLGTDGVSMPWPSVWGHTLQGDKEIYYVILPIAFLAYLFARQLLQSRIGRAFVAVRDNEIVARSCGMNVALVKATAFGVSAFYAGIGGALFALALRFIVPDGFGMFQLILHFSIVLIGGLGSLGGSVIGAVVVTTLPEVLRGFQALQEIIYGVSLVVFMLFMPRGVAGFLQAHGWYPREILIRGWREARADAGYDLATPLFRTGRENRD